MENIFPFFYTSAFFKLHYLVSHAMCALVIFVCLVSRAPEIENKKHLTHLGLGLIAVISLFLIATGLGLAMNTHKLSVSNYLHGFFGTATYCIAIYFYCYPHKLQNYVPVFVAFFAFIAVTIGVISAAGPQYFLSPKKFLSAAGDFKTSIEGTFGVVVDKKCLKCHGASNYAGILDFTNPMQFEKIYQPFKERNSSINHRINQNVLSIGHMPYKGGMLSDQERKIVLEWIDNGGPKYQQYILKEKSFQASDPRLKNWTFQKSEKPNTPQVRHAQFLKNEIDQFVISTLEEIDSFNFKPIDKALLQRRLSMILTGLPTPIKDRQLSYSQLKEKTLNSLAFAENFGLFWMDMIAFADDNGLESSKIHHRDSLEFRKYLIDTLRTSPSYFSMLREQLSHPQGSSGPNNKSLFNFIPYNEYADITLNSAVAVAFSLTLGLDMRCAQCHNHPNEPITNENYYQLVMGFQNEFKVENPPTYRNRKSKNILPEPALLNIYESAKTPPKFDDFSNLAKWSTNVEDGVGFYVARVFVDQTWNFVFGKSLTAKAGQFGAASSKPKYIDLLNWLTWDFLEHGTSIKYLIDKMISSNVFANEILLDSKYDLEKYQIYQKRILRTENIRDNVLLASEGLTIRDWNSAFPSYTPTISATGSIYSTGLFRSIYLYRGRTTEDDTNEYYMHFGISKRYLSSTNQVVPLGMEVGLFLLNEQNFREPLALIKQKIQPYNSFSEIFINDMYGRILFREANSQEMTSWKNKLSQSMNLETNVELMFRALVSSNEFLFIP